MRARRPALQDAVPAAHLVSRFVPFRTRSSVLRVPLYSTPSPGTGISRRLIFL